MAVKRLYTQSLGTELVEDFIRECEMMAGLIEGDFGDGSLEGQKEFFNKHLSAWIRHFFTDLESAKSSVFYDALGSVGKAFMEIEEAAFEMS